MTDKKVESAVNNGLCARYEKAFKWLEENTPSISYDWAAGEDRGWVVEDTAVTKGVNLLEVIEEAMST